MKAIKKAALRVPVAILALSLFVRLARSARRMPPLEIQRPHRRSAEDGCGCGRDGFGRQTQEASCQKCWSASSATCIALEPELGLFGRLVRTPIRSDARYWLLKRAWSDRGRVRLCADKLPSRSVARSSGSSTSREPPGRPNWVRSGSGAAQRPAGDNAHGYRFCRDAPPARAGRALRCRFRLPCPRRRRQTAGATAARCSVGAVRPERRGRARRGQSAPSAAEQHRLPPDSTTKQTLALPGRTLSFSATAGSIRLFDEKGEPQADIAYTSYQLDGTEARNRPVTFLFNGGPGASSAWLQLGDAGPWRLSITGEGAVASASPDLLPNAETWLDFTDLVFIDPVGTGYSRFVATGDDARKRFWSIGGDVSAIALVIRRWLEKYDRLLSPKFVAGESYGGIRGPKIVRNLQTEQGVGVRGLIMVSPVFDFRERSGSSLLQYVASLPTMAAVAREAKGPVTHKDLAEVERYARGEFLVDLLKGQADVEATTRLADKVAALTGIDPAVSRQARRPL